MTLAWHTSRYPSGSSVGRGTVWNADTLRDRRVPQPQFLQVSHTCGRHGTYTMDASIRLTTRWQLGALGGFDQDDPPPCPPQVTAQVQRLVLVASCMMQEAQLRIYRRCVKQRLSGSAKLQRCEEPCVPLTRAVPL